MNQWISLSDEMPADGERVIYYAAGIGLGSFGWRVDDKIVCLEQDDLPPHQREWLDMTPTHWLELPKPPWK